MKIKTQLTLAAVIAAGMLVSGCSQMSAQQVAAQPAAPAPAPETKTVVDCSKCAAPAPKPVARGNGHTHPAIPGCTNSTTHNHPFTNRNHKHAYSCKKPVRPVVRPVRPVAPPPAQVDRWAHTHPAIPGCTDSITHSHRYNQANHTHSYSCRQQPAMPVMPKVKAKGNYKGPIQIDGGVMQQYKQ